MIKRIAKRETIFLDMVLPSLKIKKAAPPKETKQPLTYFPSAA